MTQRIRPNLFALGTASTLFSLLMIGLFSRHHRTLLGKYFKKENSMIDAAYRLTVNSFVAASFFALACVTTGTQAHPASKEEHNSLGSCASYGNAVAEGAWSWCYNNEQDNMNGCKASYRSWVREQEQSCAQLRREAGCPPDAYDAVQWHIHGTKAGQTIGVHRAVYRTCDAAAGDEGTNARAGEASQVLDRETWSRVQSALATQGFDPGPPDGVFGPRTRGAIQSWQQASGYAGDGGN